MPGLPGVPEAAVMPGDGRHPPTQGAAAERRRQGRQPGCHHDRVNRQDRRVDPVLPRPSGEVGPVGLVGFDRPRGDRLASIVGRLGHRVGQWSIDQRQQIGRDVTATHQPPHQSLQRRRAGTGGAKAGSRRTPNWSVWNHHRCDQPHAMDAVTLPPELERFAEEAVAAGRYRDFSELVAAGVSSGSAAGAGARGLRGPRSTRRSPRVSDRGFSPSSRSNTRWMQRLKRFSKKPGE